MKLDEFLMDYCDLDQPIRIWYDEGEYVRFSEFDTLFVSEFLSRPEVTEDLLESKVIRIRSYCGRGGVDGLLILVRFRKEKK